MHLPATGAGARAQALVDRGLFLYYAYNRQASLEAFRQASALEPGLAIAAWGEALAAGPDLNTPLTAERYREASAAIAKALPIEGGVSPLERGLIDAMARRYRSGYGRADDDARAYRVAMLELARSTGDENAAMLAAEASLEHDATSNDARALVDAALTHDPAGVMANHLCVHVYENLPDHAPARPCAERLDATPFEPAAEHLAHMPAHYWMASGAYAFALASSARAVDLMDRLAASGNDPGHVAQYAGHDTAVGYSAAIMLGSDAAAKVWAARQNALSEARFDALTALRFARYDEAYASAQLPQQLAGEAVRALAALHLGRTSEGIVIAQRLQRGGGGADPSAWVHGYVAQLLFARVAESNGRIDEAARWIERARDNQIVESTPELLPVLPASEALGGLYLRAGRNADAADAFQAALETYPEDPRALFGLSLALRALGRDADAAGVRARFERAWAGADTVLSAADL